MGVLQSWQMLPSVVSVPPPLAVSVHVMQHVGAEGRGGGRGFCSPWPSGAVGNPPAIEPPVCAGPPCLIPQPTGRGLNVGLYPDPFQSF